MLIVIYEHEKVFALLTNKFTTQLFNNILKTTGTRQEQDTIEKRGIPAILNILLKSFEYLWFLRFH
jgi:hypothetical protein